jgi:hypothetical protein
MGWAELLRRLQPSMKPVLPPDDRATGSRILSRHLQVSVHDHLHALPLLPVAARKR